MDQEQKYKRTGWLVSILVQIVMLVLFYFLIAWREPDPPIPTYGIELNFGFQEVGSGAEPVSGQEAEQVEEISEEQPDEVEPEPVEESSDAVPTESVEAEQVFEDNISPDVVEETKVEPNPVPKVEEKPKEDKTEPVKEEPKINPQALMSGAKDGHPNASQGTNTNSKGDQGKEEGTIDGRSLYGSQGSADGASLNMAGWVWDYKPKPDDKSDESGKIVYKIVIDDEGYLSRIDVVSSTVSPEVERVYRQSVERLSFSKTNDYKPAPTSTGYVTFIIRTR
ncbi:hypothetical protein [Marinoscillum sp. MHG1-6]|uniref:hypothetical protein n=1 Tax=Marinoscillum sp. MHG1-6 TaxID=2959627 RepID=UPI0021586FDC|nr:hypothetical protein [Marinoscillum sp. MHG1-6]